MKQTSVRKALYNLIAAEVAYLEADGDPSDHSSPSGLWLRKKSDRLHALINKGEALEQALGRLLATSWGNADSHNAGCRCVIHEAEAALSRGWSQ